MLRHSPPTAISARAISAVFDEKGFLKIVDRKKDMIIVSGFNVYPNEVEAVATALPGRHGMRLHRRARRQNR